MLNVSHLSKEYPTPAQARCRCCPDVSFSLAPGDAAAIMGPSGSGKSSLLYVLGALEPPSSGTITLDGSNPFQLSPDALAAFRNRSVGFVFQDHCLLPQCTVLENVLDPDAGRRRRWRGCEARARRSSSRSGLSGSHRSPAGRAVGRRAPARRHRARAGARPADAPVRRADRQPRSRLCRSDRGAAARSASSSSAAS